MNIQRLRGVTVCLSVFVNSFPLAFIQSVTNVGYIRDVVVSSCTACENDEDIDARTMFALFHAKCYARATSDV